MGFGCDIDGSFGAGPVLAEGDEKARIDAKVQEAADRIAAAS